MTKRKTNEEFVSELKELNPYIVPLTAYKNSQSKVLFRCLLCGREWESKPIQELQKVGHGCRECSYKLAGSKRRKTNDEFVKELQKVNPNITPLAPYNGNKTKVKCKCNLCNNIWESTPDKLLRGIGCPDCNKTATSFIEQVIYNALSFVLGEDKVLSRNKSAVGKELDIFVPSLKLAIEYGSWYWHKSRIKSDFNKQRICEEHSIRLLLIFDGCKEGIIEANKDCYIYSYNLAYEKSNATIKQILVQICEDYNLNYSMLQNNWDNIMNLAYQKSRKLTTADFIKLLKSKNSHNIEVLGEYKSTYDAILCRCGDCGYEWSPRPNNLLNSNAGCPRCAGTIHYSNEEFISKVALMNPSFEVLEPYTYSGASILCRCRKCGYEWKATAGKLLKKRSGCPRCIGHIHYSNEEFIEKLKKINPNVTPLEQYPRSNKTKILFKCNKCGNTFRMRPNSLFSGQGCPKCAIVKASQKRIKNNEVFINELRKISPNIIPLEPYSRSKSKISCRCKKCGNEWKVTPNGLLHGYGCPVCSRREMANKNKKRVLCVETNTVYDSLKDASAQNGLSMSAISACCTGRKETAGGYHYKYIDQ